MTIKEKLLEEIADELKNKKDIISLAELLGAPPRNGMPETRPQT